MRLRLLRADRLQGLASPGQVVIGETTRSLLDDDDVLTSLGSVEVKGKRYPVTAYLVRDSGHPVREDGSSESTH